MDVQYIRNSLVKKKFFKSLSSVSVEMQGFSILNLVCQECVYSVIQYNVHV